MSRFKRADDVLIIQPFDLAIFQQGIADQPRLLLDRLRDMKKDMSAQFEELKVKDQAQAQEKKRKRDEDRKAARAQAAKKTNENMTAEAKRKRAGEDMSEEARKSKSHQGKRLKPKNSFACTGCGKRGGSRDFDPSMWRNRDERIRRRQPVLCNTCAGEPRAV